MTEDLATQRVEVRFVGAPPVEQVARASGVTEVEVDGLLLRCVVCGSFQPFLEALCGYEVVGLTATPLRSSAEGRPNPVGGRQKARGGGGG